MSCSQNVLFSKVKRRFPKKINFKMAGQKLRKRTAALLSPERRAQKGGPGSHRATHGCPVLSFPLGKNQRADR